MNGILLGTWPVGSPEWHEARASALGGSEIAAVLGLSPWESRYSLWLRKAGIVNEPKPLSNPMIVGNYVEAALQQWWSDQHPGHLERNPGTYANVDRPWQVASPDGRTYGRTARDQGLLECKFAVYDYEWGAEGTDEIPPNYLAQCRWYLDVFGFRTCHVAVLFGGSGRFAEYVVHPDPADTELIRREAVAFLESVAAGERPDVDEHSATYESIRAEHPNIFPEETVELDPDLWADFNRTQQMRDSYIDEHRGVKSRVLAAMGNARLAHFNGEPVLRRQPGHGGAIALHPVKQKRDAA